MDIIFQNEYLVVVNKPAGVLTVPGRNRDEQHTSVLGLELQAYLGQRIYPVHRLDLPVAGLVVFAKHATVHRDLNSWFENKQVVKTYRAFTSHQDFSHLPAHLPRCSFTPVKGEWTNWYGCLKKGKKRAFQSADGKPTHTRVCYLGRLPKEATTLMWDLQPVTGRPHQLRVDLSRHGFPLHGDELYGSRYRLKTEHIGLIAYRLDFSAIVEPQRWGLPTHLEIPAHFPQPA